MTEYCYSDTKSNAECVPLYHHEQVPFQSVPRPDSLSLKQNVSTNPTSCELQDVIVYYQSQPELLHLILLSKLEEDKRRAEEAKLRAKELDLLLLQQNVEPMSYQHYPNNSGNSSYNMEASPPVSSSSSTDGRMVPSHSMPRRNSIDAILASPPCSTTKSCSSTLDRNIDLEDIEFSTSTPIPTSSTSMLPFANQHYTNSNNEIEGYGVPMMSVKPQAPSLSLPMQGQTATQGKPYFTPRSRRRRREMQAITKIVETRDYPYVDGYFWKNNGNTVQRKTGNKSVYYKCSNGTKGCPVNKTVTRRENGEFLIKYRGDHLLECGRVQRIVDV